MARRSSRRRSTKGYSRKVKRASKRRSRRHSRRHSRRRSRRHSRKKSRSFGIKSKRLDRISNKLKKHYAKTREWAQGNPEKAAAAVAIGTAALLGTSALAYKHKDKIKDKVSEWKAKLKTKMGLA